MENSSFVISMSSFQGSSAPPPHPHQNNCGSIISIPGLRSRLWWWGTGAWGSQKRAGVAPGSRRQLPSAEALSSSRISGSPCPSTAPAFRSVALCHGP